nr:MAG TPA: hypothetical protein [Caudoviricetes sp.]
MFIPIIYNNRFSFPRKNSIIIRYFPSHGNSRFRFDIFHFGKEKFIRYFPFPPKRRKGKLFDIFLSL